MTRAFVTVLLAACAPHEHGPLSASALMTHVAYLADPRLEGRAAGSAGEREAETYVEARLRDAGLEPQEQAVPAGGSNVYAMIPGASDEVVVIGAHLDHLGRRDGVVYPGADDNASGVALVLGVAQTLAHQPLARSVLVVFFTAEEEGMVGSEYFVAHAPLPLSRVVAMVNVDMIARPLLDQRWARIPLHLFGVPRARAVGLVGARSYPALRALADAAFADGGEVVAAEDFPDRIEREVEREAEGRSDSVSFEARGIPALFFGDGESHDYHRPTDTIDKLHPALLSRRAHAIVRVMLALSKAPASAFASSADPPPKRKPAAGWYLPFGAVVGYRGRAVWGGEVSLVHLWSASIAYAGGYVDALHAGTTRLSFGPEIGRRWLGLDAGYLLELDRGAIVHRGVVARVFATASVISIGARVGLVDDEAFAEVDVLFKYPLRL